MTLILDGKSVSMRFLENIKLEIENSRLNPKLEIIYVGNDPASDIYINNKIRAAGEIGISAHVTHFDKIQNVEELTSVIDFFNKDDSINGIIVQSPIPGIEDQNYIFDKIIPQKDVDGFSTVNMGKLAKGDIGGFISCTPLGIFNLLISYDIKISGKHVVIIGRSNTVGRPLLLLLSQKLEGYNATVTLCHSGTKNLQEITKLADIIVVAVGRKHFLKKDMIPVNGAVVVDVGINRESDNENQGRYRIFGDADFYNIKDMCSAITPVPGGVGPMTVAMLMQNTLKAAKLQL